VDHRDRQAIRRRKGLRGAASAMGRRTHPRMDQPKPPARQGLRADHSLGNRMALYRFDPTLHPPHRKVMKLRRIILNQALREAEQRLVAMGCGKANLQIRAGNEAVALFYQRHGYEVEDRISMGKRL
jgi:hypothetical protein